MQCPHCKHHFSPSKEEKYNSLTFLGKDPDGDWGVETWKCHNSDCGKLIVNFILGKSNTTKLSPLNIEKIIGMDVTTRIPVRPRIVERNIPGEVPEELVEDFREACLVLNDSPKASAALSRRCIQHLLHLQDFKAKNLAEEIQKVLDSNTLPSYLAEQIDAVRNIGNFAAHPSKSQQSGEIQSVEPHEAEWTLDVLESLFDFYYVQPAKAKIKQDQLNEKLLSTGKQPMKQGE